MMEFLKEIGFIKEWGNLLGISGIVLGIFLIIMLTIIDKKRYSILSKKYSFLIYFTIIILVFAFAITSLILYYSVSSYYVTVFVHEGNRGDNLILTNRGKVRLIYEGADPIETINDKGVATFKQIPSIFFNSKKPVKIQFFDPLNEPYRAINPDSIYYLIKGQSISLSIKLYGLDQLKGIVKDFISGEPIQGAHIRINELDAITNEFGYYLLVIPEKEQQKYQTVRVFKNGYELYEQKNIPIQTHTDCDILMKPLRK